MRPITTLAVAAVTGLALAACADSAEDGGAGGGADSCGVAVGEPVGTATGNELDDVEGCEGAYSSQLSVSFGCYPTDGGDQEGYGFFVEDSDADVFLFGRPGGEWRSGPTDLSISEMADQIGC